MIQKKTYLKLLFTFAGILILNIGSASFIGGLHSYDNGNTFSLKNLNKYKKSYSLSSLKLSQFHFNGSQDIFEQRTKNTTQVQSMLRLENGNTTYVYPYKYKVQVPKFKTPTQPSLH